MECAALKNAEIEKHVFTSMYKKKEVNAIQQQFMFEEPHTS